ncbi:transmembrane protein 138 isoform X1 [Dromaius novaehollandiae]|uniref:Transmembrane protein 138 n=1 Tax=Dromaius novaehollandiae TaxID=8790 RepID=A0A8C4KLY3_DRONO
MLQTSNYSLVLFLQFLLLFYDLFVNSFSELLRTAPAVQLVLFIIQDIAILFNIIIIFLMFFNTFVFQAGLVNLLFHKFKGTILLSAAYLALSISFHVWVMVGCDWPWAAGFPQRTCRQATGPLALLTTTPGSLQPLSHVLGSRGGPESPTTHFVLHSLQTAALPGDLRKTQPV